jgi:hypothetical protein
VTILGNNLIGASSACRFGDQEETHALSGSSTLLRCVAPPQPPGAVSVDVSFPGGHLVSTGLAFLYVAQPEIEGVTPSVASGYGGELVTVLGKTRTPQLSTFNP